ncbi:type II secretion system minor pseudopilin GspK [Pseudomonas mosselii]|uniref:type II secretion system minor pseudopilin GspK n=1 Tax=Pseudomonas mosselii TaxID=78327 RepID=UPI00244908F7|nr:type II secretion system minor pseudopilin GspK [Pseudomonas mosselii]MDH0629380.1 type II secretion system minor pseudopilin GspK [Pseudomonas mosselii]MDH0679369.1 type II secretion system minor pseudopilin GspK [Pseudomonas mosselii]MDH0926851.1 type II secretion system minor pseudopilin GspK [Pseudomonas mosselii]MDH1137776.1 type II secretion system minor pseudopilin GspK [Pseudomonas mosselii]MDH1142683.1 type II secretion system minor pseudopilin GspK [Pseudomonas mosselii]
MAVISALLIAAVVAVIAAGMIERQGLLTRQLENHQLALQGQWALEGGLQFSRQVLFAQRLRDPLVRGGQPWAQPMRDVPSGSVRFDGQLEDEQGKFNLRNLMVDGQVDAEALATFKRLCALIGINERLATAIAGQVIDSYPQRPLAAPGKLDSGRATSPGGAVEALPARRPMLRSVEGLAGLKGMDGQALERLRRFVTVLPALTWVNGNTASAEVLAAQVPGLSLQQAAALVAERDGGRWFINRGDFVNRLRMPSLAMANVRVGINSDWFRLRGLVRLGNRELALQALLRQREGQLPDVIWRRVGA